MKAYFGDDETVKKVVEQMNEQHYMVNKVMEGCGLTRVKDTFVGDQSTVRGVSGGEKKRVTVAEMNTIGAPLICCDEISTGLDGEFIPYSRKTFLRIFWSHQLNFCVFISCHYL